MRMTLEVVGDTLQDIQFAVKRIMGDSMESNCSGWNGPCRFDYYFTDTDDIYENTDTLICINPHKEE